MRNCYHTVDQEPDLESARRNHTVGGGAVMPGSYAGHRTDGRRRSGQAADLTAVSFAPHCRETVSGKLQNRAVIEMTLATATSALESRFDRFLYAAVREDPDGTPLTVLSVLARLDIDPWKEAAKLAQLPGEAAARALAVLISALPKGSPTPSDSETIAARLITLLPHRSEQVIAVRRDPSGGPRMIHIPKRATIVARAVLFLIAFALLLVSQWLAVRHLALQPAKGPLAAPATVAPAPASPRAVRKT